MTPAPSSLRLRLPKAKEVSPSERKGSGFQGRMGQPHPLPKPLVLEEEGEVSTLPLLSQRKPTPLRPSPTQLLGNSSFSA